MKLSLISLLFLSFLSFGQKPEIVSMTTNDRVLRGDIGEDNPITMYVKVAQTSDNVGYIYSIKGWYQYNKIGTPIPLVGIWTGSDVHLFVSDDEAFKKNLLDFTYVGKKGKEYLHNYIYDLQSFTSKLPEIKERFHLTIEEHRIQGNWKSNGKEFWTSLNSNTGSILNQSNYLKLPNGQPFDLLNLGIPGRANFKIAASANNSKNILLEYSYQANLNYGGRCGGATTSGKAALVFDKDFSLKSYTNALLENCYEDLSVDNLTKVSDTVTNYKTYNYSSSKAENYLVDYKNATIKRVNSKK